jgi:hypothetical protein
MKLNRSMTSTVPNRFETSTTSMIPVIEAAAT